MLTAEILKNFTPLHTLTDEHLARLAKRVVVEDVAKGAQVCVEGDTDNDAIYLLEGGVEMRSRSSSMSRVLQAGTPDAAFPVSPGRPRPYTATATTAARIFRIDNAKLDRAVLLDEVSTMPAVPLLATANGWKRCWRVRRSLPWHASASPCCCSSSNPWSSRMARR
jgi:CRP-like cAMP-binding protein